MRQETLRRMISLALLALLVVILSVTNEYFLTASNIFTLLRESAMVGMLAIGVTMCIITGGNDLSCGALMGYSAMIIAHLDYYKEMHIAVMCLIALALSLVGGLLNGILAGSLRVTDFIATLATKFVFTGIIYAFAIRSRSGQITTKPFEDEAILALGGKMDCGLYYVTIAWILMVILGQFILKRTKLGVHIYAVGANRVSAEYSGISIAITKILTFLISAVCAFIGSLFFLGKQGSATIAGGIGLEFEAISSAVVGGCFFSGGRGDMLGTVIGVLFLQTLENGVLKLGVDSQYQQIITGAVIVLMLIFDAFYNRVMTERTTKAAAIARERKEAVAQ